MAGCLVCPSRSKGCSHCRDWRRFRERSLLPCGPRPPSGCVAPCLREGVLTSFGDEALSNCLTPHDDQVAVGLEVSCDETVVILMLLDIECVGCDCGFDDLKGAGCHCFEDGLSKEWGWGEHAESVEVGISARGGSEGAEGVDANGCCGNDAGCWLGAFGLGGNVGVDV